MKPDINIKSNFNGSNTRRTMKICLRQGYYKLMNVNSLTTSDENS